MPVKYKFSDSQLVASQVQGGYQAKNNSLIEYLDLVKGYMKKFDRAEIAHVLREQYTRADILSKLASTRKKGGNKSVIQESISRPSIEKTSTQLEVNSIGDSLCWMTPVFNSLTKGELPPDRTEATATKRRACSYVVLEHKLYRRGFSITLLKCIDESTVPEVLREIHEGINA